jgi:hypothetical protein
LIKFFKIFRININAPMRIAGLAISNHRTLSLCFENQRYNQKAIHMQYRNFYQIRTGNKIRQKQYTISNLPSWSLKDRPPLKAGF